MWPAILQKQWKVLNMKYICELCGLVYDEEKGDPKRGIEPGTPFAQLPEDYECPGCYSEKAAFTQMK